MASSAAWTAIAVEVPVAMLRDGWAHVCDCRIQLYPQVPGGRSLSLTLSPSEVGRIAGTAVSAAVSGVGHLGWLALEQDRMQRVLALQGARFV